MNAVVIYESLTGNTARASSRIAEELASAGIHATVCNVTAVNYQALADAELVIVGSWTDGFIFVGQRPGRAARLRKLPAMDGKRAVVFCTYAIDCGHTLEKLVAIVEERGAEVVGGMAIRRDRIDEGARDFVTRILDVVPT